MNVFGLAELTRLVLPLMNNDGHAVNISSMGNSRKCKFQGYRFSSRLVISLTELKEELKESGPRCNALALGAVQTQMLAEVFPGFKAPITATDFANYVLDFCLTGQLYYNGKVLQVSLAHPMIA